MRGCPGTLWRHQDIVFAWVSKGSYRGTLGLGIYGPLGNLLVSDQRVVNLAFSLRFVFVFAGVQEGLGL